jgi:hypothetical protein
MTLKGTPRIPFLAGLIAVILVVSWQAFTVESLYDGNWTALFLTGAAPNLVPAALESENIVRFPGDGYDGQWYHNLAHDPFFRRGFARNIDEPRLRSRRILLPLWGFLLGLGQDRWIDRGYFISVWTFVFLGAYWLARFAEMHDWSPWIGIGFVLLPATLISVERMTVDVVLASLCAGYAFYAQEPDVAVPWRSAKLWMVLLAAALTRETGILLPMAYCFYLLTQKRLRSALLFATALIPTVAWYAFVDSKTPPLQRQFFVIFPFAGFLDRLGSVFPYVFGGAPRIVAVACDWIALLGVAAAIAWAAWRGFKTASGPISIALYFFGLVAVFLTPGDTWAEVYGFGRILNPFLFLAALDGMTVRSLIPSAAILALVPRLAFQMLWEFLHGIRALLG